MVFYFLALLVGIPVVWHWFSFDRAEVSARSAFLFGVGCAAFAWVRESWVSGLLVFFLATLFEFAVAYVVGLIYWSFASDARSDYMDRIKVAGPSARRSMFGAVGAIAIPLGIIAAWMTSGLQTGIWDLPPMKALLGYCAFLVLGVAAAIRIIHDRRGRKAESDVR